MRACVARQKRAAASPNILSILINISELQPVCARGQSLRSLDTVARERAA
jgi:hypothetical protein